MDLTELVHEAREVGSKIDLSGVGYGRIHWGDKESVETRPYLYYHWLAGLVRVTGARNIVEIGTHHGGSARSMYRGFVEPDMSAIVTVDTNPESAEKLAGHPGITVITGDANAEAVFDRVQAAMPRPDIVYLDAIHRFMPTLVNFALYADALKPKYVVMDDITLSESMSALWGLLKDRFGDRAVNVAEIRSDIRQGPGFGLIVYSDNPMP